MTKEEELLLKYICMALPYGVIYRQTAISVDGELFTIDREASIIQLEKCLSLDDIEVPFKPFLRPMSSMTEEESNELESITFPLMEKDWDGNENPACIRWIDIPKYMDFMLSYHFDFMGLIPKGLAIEVTKENNPYKE